MVVRPTATVRSGGGATSPLTPRVYDLLAPSASEQARQLASFDEAAYRYARLTPVVVQRGTSGSKASGVDMGTLEIAAKRESEAGAEAARREVASSDPLRSGVALFQLGQIDPAEAAFKKALAANSEDPVAMAYLGSITAMRGGNAGSPAEAVRLVTEAFSLLDRAVAAATEPPAREAALVNRASVEAAVPESVFAKNAAAARDFLAVAAIFVETGDNRSAAECLVFAGMSLDRIGRESEAEIAYSRAAAFPELSARSRLELAKRGYPVH
ncbi:MAG TPA: glucodextranase DOMON-like domain-containing protein [Spirochaetia bacterium]|nr:glucodextranase DOMON-like domain-containing protein [Spirochaetia bacterium]